MNNLDLSAENSERRRRKSVTSHFEVVTTVDPGNCATSGVANNVQEHQANGTQDGELRASKLPRLVKRRFENIPKVRLFFEKQFSYLGHDSRSNKFFATCKTCAETGTSRSYSFDSNNCKTNGNRHYKVC